MCRKAFGQSLSTRDVLLSVRRPRAASTVSLHGEKNAACHFDRPRGEILNLEAPATCQNDKSSTNSSSNASLTEITSATLVGDLLADTPAATSAK